MKKYILVLFLLGSCLIGYAQVGIGVKKAGESAMLDIQNTDVSKGVLMPKVALTDLQSYSPIVGNGHDSYNIGLIVYNTTVNPTKKLTSGYHYWNGVSWVKLANLEEVLELLKTESIFGNVYYGKLAGGQKDVLYSKKIDDHGVEIIEELDLLPTILSNLEHITSEQLFELKRLWGYDITENVVYTGKSIQGKYIYSMYTTASVVNDNAEIVGVSLNRAALDLLSQGKIFKIRLLTSEFELVDVNITDIEVANNGSLTFSLGTASLYYTLPAGQYGVIVELISSIKKV